MAASLSLTRATGFSLFPHVHLPPLHPYARVCTFYFESFLRYKVWSIILAQTAIDVVSLVNWLALPMLNYKNNKKRFIGQLQNNAHAYLSCVSCSMRRMLLSISMQGGGAAGLLGTFNNFSLHDPPHGEGFSRYRYMGFMHESLVSGPASVVSCLLGR